MDFATRYKKLNAKQKAAVDHIDGPLMVVAGPGTGKTELLSMRTANILAKTDTLPQNILCLTFTESGANAMRERLTQIIGQDAYKVAIHTFHSFGSEVINQNGEYFYHGADFRPADELSSYELLRGIFDSLEYDNPLASKMNGEYTHLRDVLTAISELKKSGLTNEELLQVLDSNDAALDLVESQLADIYSSRVSKSTADALSPTATLLAQCDVPALPPSIPPLATVLALSLAHAVDAATDDDSTKPITAWKNKYMEKNETGRLVFKDRKRSSKLRAVSFIYYQYLVRMQESELYDFDDMVLRVVHAMEVFADLRLNLQEKYLYIMVDEFQDTNLAQSRILHNLTADLADGQPNIMVVGDDDQAIYSFQGAEVGNILNFRDQFEGAELITLTDNYRSADVVLEKAREVITQGTDRLEHYIDELDKTLTPHHSAADAHVELNEYETADDERAGIIDSVREQIKNGAPADSIVVLARRHHELVALLPYFYSHTIAVNYERRDNVLEIDVIVQLTMLSRIVILLATKRIGEADALLPELLAHPAWNIPAEDIWKLSLSAHKNHSTWLEEMAVQPRFTELHTWLITMASKSLVQSAEFMLDALIGTPSDTEKTDQSFTSPLYDFYFADEKRTELPTEYLLYLEALRTIRAKLREYKPNQLLKLTDFQEFIRLHQQLGASITSVRVRSDAPIEAVNLMTAHKSKGLEFQHVHIYGAIDTSWGERVRSRSRLISYPENLPLAPSGDSIDERLRLFFVAMTRARDSLTISYSLANDNDKATLRASFLAGEEWRATQSSTPKTPLQITEHLEREWYQPLVSIPQQSMQQLLAPTLENYKLSATHLNNFLDVTRGGPHMFLLNNLLRFPQSMSPSAAYGSAIHRTLQRAHAHLTADKKRKPIEDILHDFEKNLSDMYLADDDFKQFLQRGTDSLSAFFATNYALFTPSQQTELSFAAQQSRLGEAHLTGALDLVDIDEENKTMVVTDYKTGKPSLSWNGKTDYEKIKLHKYKQQLMFYKFLVENSREYGRLSVDKGIIQFVEPTSGGAIVELSISFDTAELADFKTLIQAVYRHITTLDLPDTSNYAGDYSGILAFESDLRDSTIDT